MGKNPTKSDKIIDLIEGDWTGKQLKVMVILADPFRPTVEKIAKEIGINRSTIYEWKKIPGFMEQVKVVMDYLCTEIDMEIDHANIKDAKKSVTSYSFSANAIIKARELYYKRRGLLIDKAEVKHEGAVPVTIIEETVSGNQGTVE